MQFCKEALELHLGFEHTTMFKSIESCILIILFRWFYEIINISHEGSFTNYVDKILDFFWPPTPLRWHFLPYECWQKVNIFGLPTCIRSLWTTPKGKAFDLNVFLILRIKQLPKTKLKYFYENHKIYLGVQIRIH